LLQLQQYLNIFKARYRVISKGYMATPKFNDKQYGRRRAVAKRTILQYQFRWDQLNLSGYVNTGVA
jgi:hypothetical protein